MTPWLRATATARAAICASCGPASRKGDGAEKAFIELLGAEKQLEVKRQKRDEVKAKKRAELEKQLEESKKEEEKGGEEAPSFIRSSLSLETEIQRRIAHCG